MSMTESEAKKWMNTLKNWDSILSEAQEACGIAENALSEIQQYRAIGTVEELRELKEKATAKAPYYVQYDLNPNDINYHCPTCKRFVLYTHPICSCGQKLDWSEEKE